MSENRGRSPVPHPRPSGDICCSSSVWGITQPSDWHHGVLYQMRTKGNLKTFFEIKVWNALEGRLKGLLHLYVRE